MKIKFTIWTIALMIFTALAIAMPTSTVVDFGSAEAMANSEVGDYATTGGGSTTVDITPTFQVLNWMGFYGTVSGNVQLSDGTDTMYEWNFPYAGGAVYASTLPSIDWATISAGSLSTDADVSNDEMETFTLTRDWNIGGVSVTDAPLAELYGDSGAAWNECSFDVTGGEAFGVEIQKSATCFNGQTCDFELMVPGDSQTPSTYYFYVELI